MTIDIDPRVVDGVVVVTANAFNLLIVAVMLARVRRLAWVERAAGAVDLVLLVSVVAVVIINLAEGRPWWTVVLPLPLAGYLAVELTLDNVLHSEFRRTRLLGPYLLLFYAGQMAMVGYAFLVGRPQGFATLATYFLSLGATWFSYTRVGHGVGS